MATAATSHFPTLTLEFQVNAARTAVRQAMDGLDYLDRHPDPVCISQQVPHIIANIEAAKLRLADAFAKADARQFIVDELVKGGVQ